MIISVLNWKFNDFHVMLPKPSRLQHLASVQSGLNLDYLSSWLPVSFSFKAICISTLVLVYTRHQLPIVPCRYLIALTIKAIHFYKLV